MSCLYLITSKKSIMAVPNKALPQFGKQFMLYDIVNDAYFYRIIFQSANNQITKIDTDINGQPYVSSGSEQSVEQQTAARIIELTDNITNTIRPNLGKQEVATAISASNIGAINAVSFTIDTLLPATNYKVFEFTVSGTFVGTLQVQILKNGIWSQTAVVFNFNNKNSTVGNITTGGSYLVKIDARGSYRLVATAWTSGTAIINNTLGYFDDAPSYSDKTTAISGTVSTTISGTPTFNQAASTIFATVDNANGATTLRAGTSNVCSITIANSGGNTFVGFFDGATAPTSASQTAARRAYAVVPSNSTVTIPFQPTVSFTSNVFAFAATSHNGNTSAAAGQIVFSFVIR